MAMGHFQIRRATGLTGPYPFLASQKAKPVVPCRTEGSWTRPRHGLRWVMGWPRLFSFFLGQARHEPSTAGLRAFFLAWPIGHLLVGVGGSALLTSSGGTCCMSTGKEVFITYELCNLQHTKKMLSFGAHDRRDTS